MKIRFLSISSLLVLLFSFYAFSQQKLTYETSRYNIIKHNTIKVSEIKTDWSVQLLNLDNPREGNKAYTEYIEKIKGEVEKKYPKKDISGSSFKLNNSLSVDTPLVITGFEGNPFENGVPNDNNLAISNDGMLISAINSSLYFFDTQNDTLLNHVSLSAFSDTLQVNPEQYDPKLLYDPGTDRFVVVCLSGFLDSTSNIIVGFSQTNDPLGLWNLYYLPGNLLADSSWSDFPAIALTEDELFITVNLLKNNESWQTAFKQSVIWQVNKNSGYNGQSLQTKLWSDIKFAGIPIRNNNPFQGGSRLTGPDIYLMSDKNFAVQNDTMFLLHVSNVLSDTTATLTVNALMSDKTYGMPPKAMQPMNQLLETNDARVLGGFIENNKIQFVGNTVDTLTGFVTFFHGIVSNVSGSPSIHLTLMTDTLEYGYPNISYTGKNSSNNSAIITVNYTSAHTYPGFCSFYYNDNGEYSKRVNLKSGNTYINILSGPDRWGDYSGNQRKYNDPGKVWVAGTFGKYKSTAPFNLKRQLGTWIAELQKQNDEIAITIPEYFDLLTYPNPSTDIISVELFVPYDAVINVSLYDISGKLVKCLLNGTATAGKNLLIFSTLPLRKGVYFLTIKGPNSIFLTKKIVKE
jgi:hypothetical protein